MNKVLSVLIAIVVFISLSTAAFGATHNITGSLGSSASNCGTFVDDFPPNSVFILGDSITKSGEARLNQRRPKWIVNAKGGRNVDCLTEFAQKRIDNGYVGTFVIALGTNAVEGWGQQHYLDAVDNIRAKYPNSKIVLVTTFRDPKIFNAANGYPYRRLASTQYWMTKHMYAVAAMRPNVCLAKWREVVMNSNLLHDGVHPTAQGRNVWTDIIVNAVVKCNR